MIDVETTGLSPNQHRVLEVAVVTTDPCGRVLDEWSTRINPQGPVGATHIHGIRDIDVKDAPPFPTVIDELNARLRGAAVAAHHARFDLAFLAPAGTRGIPQQTIAAGRGPRTVMFRPESQRAITVRRTRL